MAKTCINQQTMNNTLINRLKEQTANGTPVQREPQKAFAAEIIFGSPKKNCAGAGICKVVSPTSHQPGTLSCLNCGRAVALVHFVEPQTAVFRFVRKSMSREVVRKHFKNDVFLVESSFRFSQDYWQGTGQRAILPGAYLVERSDDFFTIRFRVGKQRIK